MTHKLRAAFDEKSCQTQLLVRGLLVCIP
uniref:Uncharacterized protein n=1 Tax=Arundo donax TaxID=35708 RepID=A0A0A9H6K6_ARUDO